MKRAGFPARFLLPGWGALVLIAASGFAIVNRDTSRSLAENPETAALTNVTTAAPASERFVQTPPSEPRELSGGSAEIPHALGYAAWLEKSEINPAAKKILLTGIALRKTRRNGASTGVSDVAVDRFSAELNSNQDEVVRGIRNLAARESELPQELREDLLGIAADLSEVDSPEIRRMAIHQIDESRRNYEPGSAEFNSTLVESIASYLNASADPSTAATEIARRLNLDDSHQALAFNTAKAMIEFQRTGRPSQRVPENADEPVVLSR